MHRGAAGAGTGCRADTARGRSRTRAATPRGRATRAPPVAAPGRSRRRGRHASTRRGRCRPPCSVSPTRNSCSAKWRSTIPSAASPDARWRSQASRRCLVATGEPPEPCASDVRLEEVLLEEEPLPDARLLQRLRRQVLAAPRQEEQDRVRLGERLTGIELEHRRPPRRVSRQMLGRLTLAGEDVDGHPLVGQPEVREEDANLEAVRRGDRSRRAS